MDEELKPTEARQGETRRSPRRALLWGLVIAIVVLTLIWAFWVRTAGV